MFEKENLTDDDEHCIDSFMNSLNGICQNGNDTTEIKNGDLEYENQETEEYEEEFTEETTHQTIITRVHNKNSPNFTCTNENILELIHVLNDKIDIIRNEIKTLHKSIDVKRIKKPRTKSNRCTYINRKGERCKGYFCAQSKGLCFAHYTIVNKTLKKSHYLYGSDGRKT